MDARYKICFKVIELERRDRRTKGFWFHWYQFNRIIHVFTMLETLEDYLLCGDIYYHSTKPRNAC